VYLLVFTHILLGILIFEGLTALRLYKSFGVKGLTQNSPERVESRVLFRSLRDFSPPYSVKKVTVLTGECDLPGRVDSGSLIKPSGFPVFTKDFLCPLSLV
jgi:hypothetical protein